MTYQEYSALIMDQHDQICYIADPETYEILYLNAATKKLIGVTSESEYIGTKCYELFQGKDAPCSFCTNKYLEIGKKYCWEYYNPFLQRSLSITDTFIMAGGRKVRLEMCTDISEQRKEVNRLENQLSLERTLIRCIHTLTEEADTTAAIEKLLSIVGTFYDSNRAYIFEFDIPKKTVKNTYEWCREGVTAEKNNLQDIPMDAASEWIERFEEQGEFFITSLEKDIDQKSTEYRILASQKIESLLAAPLFSDTKITGFIGVDDPKKNTRDLTLLRSLTFFVLNDLEKRRMREQLEYMSYTDALTNMSNRNKYIETLRTFAEDPPERIGVVFLDINGLKTANDTYGHSYGDLLIIQSAQIIIKCFGKNIYRIGGDEFVALCPDMDRDDFEQKVAQLHSYITDGRNYNLSVGSSWKENFPDILKMTARADELMYADKQNYYKSILSGQANHKMNMTRELFKSTAKCDFSVVLQPKTGPKGSKIAGAKAFICKYSENGRIISSDKFLPIYESEGIIRHIDFFVLETVCRALKQWQADGYILCPVSVSFSLVTLMEYDIIGKIRQTCSAYGIRPEYIDLEVSANAGEVPPEQFAELAGKAAKENFVILPDGFGDASAVSVPEDIPTVKLGRKFIENMTDDLKNTDKVDVLTGICRRYTQTEALAKSIETEQTHPASYEAEHSHTGECLFFKPVSVEKFPELFLEREDVPDGQP